MADQGEMQTQDRRDAATLARLQPSVAKEWHYRDYKNRLRLHGSQFMTLKRPSRVAESAREYVAGDPLNMIDWKAFARTDQLVVREIRDESSMTVRIAVDVGPTMAWPTVATPTAVKVTKAEVATRIALHLAYNHLRMGDQVEVWFLASDEERTPAALWHPRRPAAVLAAFAHLSAVNFAPEAAVGLGEGVGYQSRASDLAFWCGDGLGRGDVAAFLGQAGRAFFFHTLSSLELSTDWLEDGTSYFDQGDSLREYQGQALRQHGRYLEQLRHWCDDWRQRCQASGGDYMTVSDLTHVASYQAALSGFAKFTGRAASRP